MAEKAKKETKKTVEEPKNSGYKIAGTVTIDEEVQKKFGVNEKDVKTVPHKKNHTWIIVLAIIVAIVLVGVLSVKFSNDRQEKILSDEVSTLASKNVATDDFSNIDIKTNGNYAKTERAIKEFMKEYSDAVKAVMTDMEEEQSLLEEILKVSNYERNGPEFTDQKQAIKTQKEKFDTNIDKVINMLGQSTIMSRIDNAGVSAEYVELYRNSLFGENSLAIKIANDESEMTVTKLTLDNAYSKSLQLLEFLTNNKDNWKIENSKITFNNASLLAQYTTLRISLSAD